MWPVTRCMDVHMRCFLQLRCHSSGSRTQWAWKTRTTQNTAVPEKQRQTPKKQRVPKGCNQTHSKRAKQPQSKEPPEKQPSKKGEPIFSTPPPIFSTPNLFFDPPTSLFHPSTTFFHPPKPPFLTPPIYLFNPPHPFRTWSPFPIDPFSPFRQSKGDWAGRLKARQHATSLGGGRVLWRGCSTDRIVGRGGLALRGRSSNRKKWLRASIGSSYRETSETCWRPMAWEKRSQISLRTSRRFWSHGIHTWGTEAATDRFLGAAPKDECANYHTAAQDDSWATQGSHSQENKCPKQGGSDQGALSHGLAGDARTAELKKPRRSWRRQQRSMDDYS